MIQRKKGSKAKERPLIEYRGWTIKQIKEHIESKNIEELTLNDLFLYECITGIKPDVESILNPKSQEMPYKDTLEEKDE